MKRKRGHRRRRRMKRQRIYYDGPLEMKRLHVCLDLITTKEPRMVDPETIDGIVNFQMGEILSQDTRAKYYNSVADLKEIQSLNDELKAKMYAETAAVEASYHKLCEQLYSKRFQIVNGLVPARNAHIHDAMRSSFKDELKNEAMESTFEETTKNKGVPNFWLTVMKAKPELRQQISRHDEEVLKFLKDIKLCHEPVGFKLEFDFAENPFFKNQTLTKTYRSVDPNKCLPWDIAGTIIEWYGDRHLSGHELFGGEGSFFRFFASFRSAPFPFIRRLLFLDNLIRCAFIDIIHGAIPYFLENTDLPECPIVVEYFTQSEDVSSSEEEEEEVMVNKSLYKFYLKV